MAACAHCLVLVRFRASYDCHANDVRCPWPLTIPPPVFGCGEVLSEVASELGQDNSHLCTTVS